MHQVGCDQVDVGPRVRRSWPSLLTRSCGTGAVAAVAAAGHADGETTDTWEVRVPVVSSTARSLKASRLCRVRWAGWRRSRR
ncbi:hypothetical protein [Microbispora bryophytorum]|uniref:hypothetical protein n=1 Tax=Microbispora bryophytorum TaxID=1460882 RepID=UPI0033EED444